MQKLRESKNEKEMKFFGSNPVLVKVHKNLSGQTNSLRQFVRKQLELDDGTFRNVYSTENQITEIPCLVQYSSSGSITPDACTKGLEATLLQKQSNGNLKRIAFAS